MRSRAQVPKASSWAVLEKNESLSLCVSVPGSRLSLESVKYKLLQAFPDSGNTTRWHQHETREEICAEIAHCSPGNNWHILLPWCYHTGTFTFKRWELKTVSRKRDTEYLQFCGKNRERKKKYIYIYVQSLHIKVKLALKKASPQSLPTFTERVILIIASGHLPHTHGNFSPSAF